MGRKYAIHPVDPTRQLPGAEVADVLRQIAAGDLAWEPVEPGRVWAADAHGEHVIRAGGYTLTLSNDNGSLDYVERAVAPDGRKGSFEFWFDRGQEPVQLLSLDEAEAVERALTPRRTRR